MKFSRCLVPLLVGNSHGWEQSSISTWLRRAWTRINPPPHPPPPPAQHQLFTGMTAWRMSFQPHLGVKWALPPTRATPHNPKVGSYFRCLVQWAEAWIILDWSLPWVLIGKKEKKNSSESYCACDKKDFYSRNICHHTWEIKTQGYCSAVANYLMGRWWFVISSGLLLYISFPTWARPSVVEIIPVISHDKSPPSRGPELPGN